MAALKENKKFKIKDKKIGRVAGIIKIQPRNFWVNKVVRMG
jgi:hypothetical protein